MLFQRRHPPTWAQRLRVMAWPRRSFARSARYVFWRVLRGAGSAHGLALGVAIGVLVATLPLPGVQLLAAALAAWCLRGNVPAALLATFWANPLTTPILWAGSYWLGCWMIGMEAVQSTAELFQRIGQFKSLLALSGSDAFKAGQALVWPIFKPLAVGSVPIGAISAVVFYGLARNLIEGYRQTRFATLPDRTPALTLSSRGAP